MMPRLVAATEAVPKFVSPSDPAAQWIGALKEPAFFACANNYLIDVQFGVIVNVEAPRAVRQAEVGAAKTVLERTEERFGLKPQRLAADSAYGSAPMLDWLVAEKQIMPHIPVLDKSKRQDGTSSSDRATAIATLIRQRRLTPSRGGQSPYRGENSGPARTIAENTICQKLPLQERTTMKPPAVRDGGFQSLFMNQCRI
jgi:hypothetical protein